MLLCVEVECPPLSILLCLQLKRLVLFADGPLDLLDELWEAREVVAVGRQVELPRGGGRRLGRAATRLFPRFVR